MNRRGALSIDGHLLFSAIDQAQVVGNFFLGQNVELLAFSNNTDGAVLDVQLSGLLVLDLFGGLVGRQSVSQGANSVDNQILAITGLNISDMLLQVGSGGLAAVTNRLSSPVIKHARGASLVDVCAGFLEKTAKETGKSA